MAISGLNHAVLYVRNATRTVRFYEDVLDFVVLEADPGGKWAFMNAPGSHNDHDIAFFSIGDRAGPPTAGGQTVGLYHLAWEVATMEDLATAFRALTEAGALSGASDHGVSKSLYGRDPDGNEFEILWSVPREAWGEYEKQAVVLPLDLERELARWGSAGKAQ